MKNLIPFIALILLVSCSNRAPKARENKQIQTIHQFIRYLKYLDFNKAMAMLPVQDTSYLGIEDHNHAAEQIDSAAAALWQPGDIAPDSLWVSDTISTYGSRYLFFVAPLIKDLGNPNPEYVFRFTFLLVNSDTLFFAFDYTHTPYDIRNKDLNRGSKPMQIIHRFISHLQSNDLNGALAILLDRDTSFHKRNTEYYVDEQHAIFQINNACLAFRQNDIAHDSFWESDTIKKYGNLHLYFMVPWKKDIANPDPEYALYFKFLLVNSDTLFDSFDYSDNPFGDLSQAGMRSNNLTWIVQEFMECLKNNDVKDAKDMLSIPDTDPASAKRYMNNEMTQIYRARKALQQEDIPDYSTWIPDVFSLDGHRYFSLRNAKEDTGKFHSKSAFKFVFCIDSSEASLVKFYYTPPNDLKLSK